MAEINNRCNFCEFYYQRQDKINLRLRRKIKLKASRELMCVYHWLGAMLPTLLCSQPSPASFCTGSGLYRKWCLLRVINMDFHFGSYRVWKTPVYHAAEHLWPLGTSFHSLRHLKTNPFSSAETRHIPHFWPVCPFLSQFKGSASTFLCNFWLNYSKMLPLSSIW